MSDNRVTVAELIQGRRDQLGLNDEQAADQLGVAQTTFGRWRTGKFVPDDGKLAELAAWLNVPEDEVALAMVQGRRRRPPVGDRVNPADVLAELAALRARVDELERAARQPPG
jgi:transcriptional regulator with XRE-family HTH domain